MSLDGRVVSYRERSQREFAGWHRLPFGGRAWISLPRSGPEPAEAGPRNRSLGFAMHGGWVDCQQGPLATHAGMVGGRWLTPLGRAAGGGHA
eukprot:363666-Chlamydomonas_euryale.AAC.2